MKYKIKVYDSSFSEIRSSERERSCEAVPCFHLDAHDHGGLSEILLLHLCILIRDFCVCSLIDAIWECTHATTIGALDYLLLGENTRALPGP